MNRTVVLELIADGRYKTVPRRRIPHPLWLDYYKKRGWLSKSPETNAMRWGAGIALATMFDEVKRQPTVISRYAEMVGHGSVENYLVHTGATGKLVQACLDHVGNVGRDVILAACLLDEPVGKEKHAYFAEKS